MLMIKNDPNQLDYEVQTAIKTVLFKNRIAFTDINMHTADCLIHAQEIKTVFAEVQPEVPAIPCGKRTKKIEFDYNARRRSPR